MINWISKIVERIICWRKGIPYIPTEVKKTLKIIDKYVYENMYEISVRYTWFDEVKYRIRKQYDIKK